MRKGRGFEQPPRPHQHWHIDVSYIDLSGTFYYLPNRATGACSRSTESAIVALRALLAEFSAGKRGNGQKTENARFGRDYCGSGSRAVGTAKHQSHRTIDPQCTL